MSTDVLARPLEATGPERMVPEPFAVVSRRQDTRDTWTLELAARSGRPFEFAPGQFTMVSSGGCGEVPVSISGDPSRPDRLEHTVRAAGLATQAICAAEPGASLWVRGPFGRVLAPGRGRGSGPGASCRRDRAAAA